MGAGLALVAMFQCALAWKILSRLGPSELLGEVNDLFPSGMLEKFKKKEGRVSLTLMSAVGTKITRFVEKEDFNALNMSDPEWERSMPRKCTSPQGYLL